MMKTRQKGKIRLEGLGLDLEPEIAAFAVAMDSKLKVEGVPWRNQQTDALKSRLLTKAIDLVQGNDSDLFTSAVVIGALAMAIASRVAADNRRRRETVFSVVK